MGLGGMNGLGLMGLGGMGGLGMMGLGGGQMGRLDVNGGRQNWGARHQTAGGNGQGEGGHEAEGGGEAAGEWIGDDGAQ